MDKNVEESRYLNNYDYIYKCDKHTISFEEIENELNSVCKEKKIEYLKNLTTHQNRFAIELKSEKHAFLDKLKILFKF